MVIDAIAFSVVNDNVTKFYYDYFNCKIEVHFESYYSKVENRCIREPCFLTIKNWEEAKSKSEKDQVKFDDLEDHIGLFDMVLSIEKVDEDNVDVYAVTLDDRYIHLRFIKPEISLTRFEDNVQIY